MEPLEYDISFPRGNTCEVTFSLLDANGEPLTPSLETEIYFTLKDNYRKTPYLLQKRYTNGGITVVDGVCSFTLTHADTANLQYSKKYDYDIEVKDGNVVYTLIIGILQLTKNSTHMANE